MKSILLTIAVCFGLSVEAVAQVKLGLDLSVYSSTLKNISSDKIVDYGYSGATVTQARIIGITPTILLRKNFCKNFSLETGLGYLTVKHKLNLALTYPKDEPFLRPAVDADFNISLNYIQIPVSILYSIPLKGNTKLYLASGVRTRFLFSQEDNYQNIIYELISINDNRYNRFVFAQTASIAMNNMLPNGHTYEFGFFGNYDVNPIVDKDRLWGFFENLYPARKLDFGLSLKYFL